MNIHAFTKTCENKQILSFPGTRIIPGSITVVMGANGCGKSTFARILSGVLPSDQKHSPFETDPGRIGYLPQKPYSFHMTVRQNLMIGADKAQKNSQNRADKLLSALDLTELSVQNASSLSGGEASRMCLARLLMQDHDLLILDEPCASMDIASTLKAESLIQEYRKNTSASVILITHNLGQARRMADTICFFHKGTLVESGKAQDLLLHPQKEETKEFLRFYS